MYGSSSFTVEDIMSDKALEFRLKLAGMKYSKDGAIVSVKEKGNKYTRSMKAIKKILNGKPITELRVFESIQTIKVEKI